MAGSPLVSAAEPEDHVPARTLWAASRISAGSIRPGSNRRWSLRVRRSTWHELSVGNRPRRPSTSRKRSALGPPRQACSSSITPGSLTREAQIDADSSPGKAARHVHASGSGERRANQPWGAGKLPDVGESAARIDAASTPAMKCAEGWARNWISQAAVSRSRQTVRTSGQPAAESTSARHQSLRSRRKIRGSRTRTTPALWLISIFRSPGWTAGSTVVGIDDPFAFFQNPMCRPVNELPGIESRQAAQPNRKGISSYQK